MVAWRSDGEKWSGPGKTLKKKPTGFCELFTAWEKECNPRFGAWSTGMMEPSLTEMGTLGEEQVGGWGGGGGGQRGLGQVRLACLSTMQVDMSGGKLGIWVYSSGGGLGRRCKLKAMRPEEITLEVHVSKEKFWVLSPRAHKSRRSEDVEAPAKFQEGVTIEEEKKRNKSNKEERDIWKPSEQSENKRDTSCSKSCWELISDQDQEVTAVFISHSGVCINFPYVVQQYPFVCLFWIWVQNLFADVIVDWINSIFHTCFCVYWENVFNQLFISAKSFP